MVIGNTNATISEKFASVLELPNRRPTKNHVTKLLITIKPVRKTVARFGELVVWRIRKRQNAILRKIAYSLETSHASMSVKTEGAIFAYPSRMAAFVTARRMLVTENCKPVRISRNC